MRIPIRFTGGLAAVALAAFSAVGCGGDETKTPSPTQSPTITATSAPATATPTAQMNEPPGEGTTVAIANFTFTPETLTVPVGSTVTWTNADAAPHRMVATTSGGFNAGTAKQGESVQATFDEAGEFPYICEIHPQMKGTIVVVS